jgi:hypothetical protein
MSFLVCEWCRQFTVLLSVSVQMLPELSVRSVPAYNSVRMTIGAMRATYIVHLYLIWSFFLTELFIKLRFLILPETLLEDPWRRELKSSKHSSILFLVSLSHCFPFVISAPPLKHCYINLPYVGNSLVKCTCRCSPGNTSVWCVCVCAFVCLCVWCVRVCMSARVCVCARAWCACVRCGLCVCVVCVRVSVCVVCACVCVGVWCARAWVCVHPHALDVSVSSLVSVHFKLY